MGGSGLLGIQSHMEMFFSVLQLMHELSQPLGFNPCDQLRCSHLCLLAPPLTGRSGSGGSPAASKLRSVCRCPKGLVLSKDQTTCSPPVESTFILLLSHSTIYQVNQPGSSVLLSLAPFIFSAPPCRSTSTSSAAKESP